MTPVPTSTKLWFPTVTFLSDNEAFLLLPTHDTYRDDVKKQALQRYLRAAEQTVGL